MNIYNCRDKNDNWAYSVAEETSGKAKAYFANEMIIDFVDVRCQIIKKDVGDKYHGFLSCGEMDELGIEYYDEEI